MNLDRYWNDHAKILEGIALLRNLVKLNAKDQAPAIASTLSTLTSTIKLHLAIEDRALYPALARQAGEAAVVGKRFQTQMSGLAKTYGDFVTRWRLPESIAGAPDQFRSEANTVFKALYERMQLEKSELYPIAEQV